MRRFRSNRYTRSFSLSLSLAPTKQGNTFPFDFRSDRNSRAINRTSRESSTVEQIAITECRASAITRASNLDAKRRNETSSRCEAVLIRERERDRRDVSLLLSLSLSLLLIAAFHFSGEKREQKRRDGFRRVGKENSRCAERIIKRQGSITETIRAFRGVKRLLTSDHRRRIVPVGRQHLSPRDAAEFAHSASDGLVEDRRVAY